MATAVTSRAGPLRRHRDKAAPLVLELACTDCGSRFTLHGHEAWMALRGQAQGVGATCGCRAAMR